MKDKKDPGTIDFLPGKEIARNCWNCNHLSATVGGWHCMEHNIFLHEQTHHKNVGHGGNGCDKYLQKKPPIFIGVDLARDKDSTHYTEIKNNKD